MESEFRKRVFDNYHLIRDPDIIHDVEGYVLSHDCRLEERTLDLKGLTKILSYAKEYLDYKVLITAAAYCKEGIRRIETGIAKHDPDYETKAFDTMLPHLYSHASVFMLIAGEKQQEEAHIIDALQLVDCALEKAVVDEEKNMYTMSRGMTLFALGKLKQDKDLLIESLGLLKSCDRTNMPQGADLMLCSSLAENYLRLAECGHDAKAMLDFCIGICDEAYYKYPCVKEEMHFDFQLAVSKYHLYELADDETQKKVNIVQAYMLVMNYYKNRNLNDRESIFPICEDIAIEYLKFIDGEQLKLALVDLAENKVALVEALYQRDPVKHHESFLYSYTYSADFMFRASELADYEEKIVYLKKSLEYSTLSVKELKKYSLRHWAMTWINIGKYAEALFEVAGDDDFRELALQAWNTGLNYFKANPDPDFNSMLNLVKRKTIIHSAKGTKAKKVIAIAAKGKTIRHESERTTKIKYRRQKLDFDDTAMWE